MLKGLKTQEQITQGKTFNKMPRRINHNLALQFIA